jgi:PAS domain S-box-containing protein
VREELQLVAQAVAKNAPFPEFNRELEERCRDGSTIWTDVTATGIRGEDGRIVGIFGIARNITERKKADKALAEREAELRAIFENSQDAIGVAQMGISEMVNPALLSMFGYQRVEELVGKPLLDLVAPESRELVLASMRAHAQGGNVPSRYEVVGLRRDGTTFPLETNISTYERGGSLHTVVSLRDLSERVRLEDERRHYENQLRRNEKMESLGALAGGVAHDMNNVLGAVLGLASVHLEDMAQGSALRKDMETIVKACERGGSMVRGLLGFARDTLPEERELDLNIVVREAVALLERTTLQRIHLEMDLAPGLLHLKGDAAALSHVLMNLCVNAVDAMPEGGTLSVRTRNDEDSTILLEVADSGIGMSKEVLDKALDPFFTTKPQGKGTGLGLPIVFRTIKAHQGRLDISSEVGRGTQVRIHFPACKAGVKETKTDAESPLTPRPTALRILVVDDDELLQHAVRRLLKNLGHAATSVAGGESALAMIETGFQPDLVILDMNMPGMDGAAALPRIRALCPNVPVLLATGRADQKAIDLVETHARVTLLPKPFDLRSLRQALQRLAQHEVL